MPRASIVILSKDRPFLVRSCLEALVQTVDHSATEILLGDTGSTDPEVFRLYDEIGKSFSGRFEVIPLENYHFSRNNNMVAAGAKGNHLVFLNNDTVPKPGWLKPMLNRLDEPDGGVVGAKLLYPHNGRVQHAGIEFVGSGPYKYHGYHPYRGRHSLMRETCRSREVPAVTGACLGIARERFQRLGSFDETFKEDSQDVDLCLRVQQEGKRCFLETKSLLYHMENGTRDYRDSPGDKRLILKRWNHFIDEFFLQKTHGKGYLQLILEGGEEEVFAITGLVTGRANTHITLKTRYPNLADSAPGFDRVLDWDEPDNFVYERVLYLPRESWSRNPGMWTARMAEALEIEAPAELKPRFRFSPEENQLRKFFKNRPPYVVGRDIPPKKNLHENLAQMESAVAADTSNGLTYLTAVATGTPAILRKGKKMETKNLQESLKDKQGISLGKDPLPDTPLDYILMDSRLFLLGEAETSLREAKEKLVNHGIVILYHRKEDGGALPLLHRLQRNGDLEVIARSQDDKEEYYELRYLKEGQPILPPASQRPLRYEVADRIHSMVVRLPFVKDAAKDLYRIWRKAFT